MKAKIVRHIRLARMAVDMKIEYKRVFLMLLLLCCAPCMAATKVQIGELQYRIEKTPAWVERVDSPSTAILPVEKSGATQVLLSDIQVNLLGPKPTSYIHTKNIARERSGLESVSTILIAFNPRFETLTLHDLAIIRDGKRADRLKSARIDQAQRERRLEEGIYDEALEIIVALADVRTGDIVEVAYSITGENPVLGGKYSRIFGLNQEQLIEKLSVRIQYPATRKLRHKVFGSNLAATETSERGVNTLRLNAGALMPWRTELEVPPWFVMFPWLQVTEYESWDEVGAWARNLYSIPTDFSQEIDAVLSTIKAEAKTPRDLVAKTLAWVQNEIRYYSVAVGTSSHRPNHPNVTVRQRFGDCKDKSVLLSAMLQKLGIYAEPALVSYRLRKGISEWLPTHQVFDHVVVQVRLGNETYWLDGTQTYQGSTIENLGFTSYGKALPVGATGAELTDVIAPAQSRNGSDVVETFEVSKYGAPVIMTVEQKYFGTFCEWFRRRAATDGLKRLVEMQQAEYGRDFPNITLSGDARIEDNPVSNVLTFTQAYAIPQFFSYESGRVTAASTYARSIIPWLRFPGMPNRQYPLALVFPGTFEHSIVVNLPHGLPTVAPAPANWQDRHIVLNNSVTQDDTRISLNYSLRMLQDHVAAADFPDFSEKLKQASNLLFKSLSLPPVDSASLRKRLVLDFEQLTSNSRKADHADNLLRLFVRDYAVADESIKSGLLVDNLLAKAYADRAEAGSLLGRKEEALADASKAADLSPNDDAYILKAEIQLYTGRFQDALNTLQLVARKEDQREMHTVMGMSNYYLGQYEEAIDNFNKAAEYGTSESLPYSLIWLAAAEKKINRTTTSAVKKHLPRLPKKWPAEAINLFLGDSTPEKLIADATLDENQSRLHLCEAYFYLGQKALLDGKPEDAKRWFKKSIDTKAVMYREHTFSQLELKRLEETPVSKTAHFQYK